jgi:hypothetical protein
MLKITIELIPFGDEKLKRVIEQFTVENDGSHPARPEMGNYEIDHKSGIHTVRNHFRKDGLFPLMGMVFAKLANEAERLKSIEEEDLGK